MNYKFLLCLIVYLITFVIGDMYLHNPPGCNDRNRERSDNRNNGNRIFDSQNNGAGGYPYRGDPAYTHVLHDAQGNPKYQGGPYYDAGTLLRVEWTSQHGCGPNPNIQCNVILQYSCDYANDDWLHSLPGVRDGYPSGGVVESDNNNAGYQRKTFVVNNNDGTNTVAYPEYDVNNYNTIAEFEKAMDDYYHKGLNGGIEYGIHESWRYYRYCNLLSRNQGLYLSDQNVNQNDATGTRQNNNGNRNGLECPEERDYYPWWHASPWIDIAYLSNDVTQCTSLVKDSFNVKGRHWCNCTASGQCNNDGSVPISEDECKNLAGIWQPIAPHNKPAPECVLHSWNADNHLGASTPVDDDGKAVLTPSSEPEMAHYLWQLPKDIINRNCVFRIRYNMSTIDNPSSLDSKSNCVNKIVRDVVGAQDVNDADYDQYKVNVATENHQCNAYLVNPSNEQTLPLINRPYADMFPGDEDSFPIAFAFNTDQTGRVFQDRSFVFHGIEMPSDTDEAKKLGFGDQDSIPDPWSDNVWNLNNRGRRGNIVQAYPAVEYDFVPRRLIIKEDDWILIRFFGSDFNAAKNANNGEGWQYSDRFNIIQLKEGSFNFPKIYDSTEGNEKDNLFPSKAAAKLMALVGQDKADCVVDAYFGNANNDNDQNIVTNCGKLNKATNVFPKIDKRYSTLFKMEHANTYYYMSSRNNNFSNRSQKASITVEADNFVTLVIGSVAGAAVVAGILFGSCVAVAKRNENSWCGRRKCLRDCC